MEFPTNETGYDDSGGVKGNESLGFCDEEANPNFRLFMISFGMLIALVGCVCNLFLFSALLGVRGYMYQCFLAFLDFTMCELFVQVFWLLRISQVLEIKWLYDGIQLTYTITFVLSRLVQIAIPYVLIAISAERFGQIKGRSNFHSKGSRRLLICFIIATITIFMRGPLIFAVSVKPMEGCDKYFYSKILQLTKFGESNTWRILDFMQQFLNLFVTFLILCLLNILIVQKLKKSHQRARRQSASVSHTLELTCKLPKSQSMRKLDDETKREQKRVRCAIRTTTVIISCYLACNALNFLLFCLEQAASKSRHLSSLIFNDETQQFTFGYLFMSDLGTNLFVLSSAIRVFIYYKYNPEIRKQIRNSLPFYNMLIMQKRRRKSRRMDPIVSINGNASASGGGNESLPLQTIQFIDN
ncbi:unnamed protein product, partial [Mesorhabditis belari]|uniref:G-protein coupled receptors family 1 profile domain-containing protein n=1 Tax=Mesorhabditis belari TaxID=2138241 RepID=A0AAF3EGM0_9BILA